MLDEIIGDEEFDAMKLVEPLGETIDKVPDERLADALN